MSTKIIDPVPVELLKAELTKSKKLEDTNKGHNELYIVTWQDSPNVVTEIGRLRELTFRDAGGATGNALDLDAKLTAFGVGHTFVPFPGSGHGCENKDSMAKMMALFFRCAEKYL